MEDGVTELVAVVAPDHQMPVAVVVAEATSAAVVVVLVATERCVFVFCCLLYLYNFNYTIVQLYGIIPVQLYNCMIVVQY